MSSTDHGDDMNKKNKSAMGLQKHICVAVPIESSPVENM